MEKVRSGYGQPSGMAKEQNRTEQLKRFEISFYCITSPKILGSRVTDEHCLKPCLKAGH